MSMPASAFMYVRFWGTRGSIPTPGRHTLRFGGNTSCVEIRTADTLVIIDCGSGLHNLGRALPQSGECDTPPEERFDRITRLAASIFNAPMASISLVDRNRQWFKSSYGLEAVESSRE